MYQLDRKGNYSCIPFDEVRGESGFKYKISYEGY